MIYSEWNEHIAKLFFKPDNAGKDILFYLTREDLIKYSRANFNGTTDENIWADFIHAIKFDQQEGNDFRFPYSPIAKPPPLGACLHATTIYTPLQKLVSMPLHTALSLKKLS